MINQIFNLIIDLLFFIVNLLLKIILAIFPDWGLTDQIATIIDQFFNLLTNATALTYFLIGPLTSYFIVIIINLFALKHIALPIINFTRKVIIK